MLAYYDKKVNTTYEILFNVIYSYQNNFISKTIITVVRLIRGCGLYVLLLILNALIAYKLQKHISKKKNMVLRSKEYLKKGKN